MKIVVCAQESLLSSIFGFYLIAQHAITKIVDGFLIRLDDVGEGFMVTLTGLLDPNAFIILSGSGGGHA